MTRGTLSPDHHSMDAFFHSAPQVDFAVPLGIVPK